MMSRAVGIAGMKPLFGVRAIAEAAGLDGPEVTALMASGARSGSRFACGGQRRLGRVPSPLRRSDNA